MASPVPSADVTKTFDATLRLAEALELLGEVRDIVAERIEEPAPPAWLKRRNWYGFLSQLNDDELGRCEAEGLLVSIKTLRNAPADLLELADEVERATTLPSLTAPPREISSSALQAVSRRKQHQLAALLAALEKMGRAARRIVDVGSGSGHLTRLAAELFEREALGLEHNQERVKSATARAGSISQVRYLVTNACADLELADDELALGLHACGALGDHLVRTAATVGCDLALVSCCAQKVPGSARSAISRAGHAFSLPREVLGLTNLSSQAHGVEAPIASMMQAREARYALRRLLAARGLKLAVGAEMSGINRRRARFGFQSLAERALDLRGLNPASSLEIAEHEALAKREYGLIRRLSLPRSMLSRLVEVSVVLDRAAFAQECGAHVVVATVCDRAFTPRNIGLFASRTPERLPHSANA